MTQLTTIKRICEHLGKYVYDKIWNDPYSEYRTFFKAMSLNTVPTAGIFFGRYSQIQLPSEVVYKSGSKLLFYVYSIPAAVFRTLKVNTLTWTQLDQFCDGHLIDFEFFSQNGRKAIRNSVFLRQADMNDCILVAIEREAFHACFGTDAKADDTYYFGKYHDSDLDPSVKYICRRLKSIEVPNNQKSETKTDPIIRDGKPTYTLYNGRLLTGNYMKRLASNSFVENAFDENIIGIFDVDACDPAKQYLSKTEKRRLLIHIPKTINTDHVIITPNTCDLYLVPTKMIENGGHPEVSGVYLFQCGREEHFHQLTHNDFSIDVDWLEELAGEYGFVEYYVKVMVRTHGKNKSAIRDANYLNILYIHDDEDIIKFLLGTTEYNMPFWAAKELEDSMYGKYLLSRRNVKLQQCPEDQCQWCKVADWCKEKPITEDICDTYSNRSLNDYIDAIGYYHTLALIGKRVTHFEVVKDKLGTKYQLTKDTIALKGKSYYANNPEHENKFEKLDLKVDDPIPTSKRVYEESPIQSPEMNEFVVRAPLALLDLEWIDYKAVVYHNGLRIPDEQIEIKVGPNVDNQHHREIEFTPDATWWTKVIDVNYAQRLRVIVKDETFVVGDKVCIEIFDNRHNGRADCIEVPADPSTMPIQLVTDDEWKIYRVNDEQDVPFEKTKDEKFLADRTYYVLYPGSPNDFRKIIDTTDLIGKPIDGTSYSVQIEGRFVHASEFYELTDYYKVNNITFYLIKDPGTFDPVTKQLILDQRWAGYKVMIVEGPLFFEDQGSREITNTSTMYLGDELWKRPDIHHDNFPLDSEIVFLNKHRLVRGLDYTTEGYIPEEYFNGAKLYLQNVSYLEHQTKFQMLRTCQTTLSNQRGFVKGDIIQWNHSNPFWFDELSILTVNGEVCSNIQHHLGTITLLDFHDNGTPFEFRMSVSTKIKNLLGNHGEQTDRARIEMIKTYFDLRFRRPDYLTIVKKAHKIYSLYMEQIITAYVRDPLFSFVYHPSMISFEDQFKAFTDWKRRDVSYNLSAEDMKYVDVYPMFNRLQMDDRYQYDQISYLVQQLRPTDKYKHKDANNVK